MITSDKSYRMFQLWENPQDLSEEAIYLMAKGFIEKNTGKSDGLAKDFIFFDSRGHNNLS